MNSKQKILTTLGMIDELQVKKVEEWHQKEPQSFSEDFLDKVAEQHWQNFQLWHEEDKARDPHASDLMIAKVKRSIDGLNQKRNDLIEILDERLISLLSRSGCDMLEEALLNSETPGSIIDRCSITALKTYHMEEEAKRVGATDEHRNQARVKVKILRIQRSDLFTCLQELIEGIYTGERRFQVYRQFKMYNDPAMNPYLYKNKKTKGKH